MTNKEIGQRIEDRRHELGYTLDDIAAKIGVAKSTIQRYEKGQIQKIKLPVIESIAGVLGVNPNWLIGNTSVKETEQPTKSGELSPIKKEFIGFVETLSEEQAARALRVLRTIVEELP